MGDNKPWYREICRRLEHLTEAMAEGKLIDESCECFADAVLFGAAVRSAEATWDDEMGDGTRSGLSDELPEALEAEVKDETDEEDTDSSMRWGMFVNDMDDRMPYREWDCAFPGYRKTRLLLDHRPARTWFDEPDEMLDEFRAGAPYNLMLREIAFPRDFRIAQQAQEIWEQIPRP